jgi:hypothetical protein
MKSPYEDLPPQAFWKTAVMGQQPDYLTGLYRAKFPIRRDAIIATAGSCFAQHIARHLKARRFNVLDAEPAPRGLSPEAAQRFGYGLYSARYGNIYTARQLRQLAEETLGLRRQDIVWEKDGRYYDALRPSVEPEGLLAPETVRIHRAYHLSRVQQVLQRAETFIFTLGLTEGWVHADSGTVLPMAPGVVAGDFDPALYQFKNFTFQDTYEDLRVFFDLLEKKNSNIRFVLTVSPVPLTATATGDHVLQATTYSKSVLRAVCGQLAQERGNVDYVPSYEVITSALSGGRFFEKNQRTIRPEGVEAVMRMFFSEHGDTDAFAHLPAQQPKHDTAPDEDELVCEEAMLEAFAE